MACCFSSTLAVEAIGHFALDALAIGCTMPVEARGNLPLMPLPFALDAHGL